MHVKHNFSLIECIIVLLILGVFALIALPSVMEGATIAKTNACKTNVMILNFQLALYYQNEGKWPPDFNALINDPDYFPDGIPKCPFGHAYTIHISNRWIHQHSH